MSPANAFLLTISDLMSLKPLFSAGIRFLKLPDFVSVYFGWSLIGHCLGTLLLHKLKRKLTCSFCHLDFVKELPQFGRKISSKIG